MKEINGKKYTIYIDSDHFILANSKMEKEMFYLISKMEIGRINEFNVHDAPILTYSVDNTDNILKPFQLKNIYGNYTYLQFVNVKYNEIEIIEL